MGNENEEIEENKALLAENKGLWQENEDLT